MNKSLLTLLLFMCLCAQACFELPQGKTAINSAKNGADMPVDMTPLGPVEPCNQVECIQTLPMPLMMPNTPHGAIHHFGASLATDGDWLVVGAPHTQIDGAPQGAVFVYYFEADAWTHKQTLLPTGLAPERTHRDFGRSVVIQKPWIIVGAPGESTQGDALLGQGAAVYTFKLMGSTWEPKTPLHGNPNQPTQRFGASLALERNTLAIGAPKSGDKKQGFVYMYTLNGNMWKSSDLLKGTYPNEHLGATLTFPDDLYVGSAQKPGIDANPLGSVMYKHIFENEMLGASYEYYLTTNQRQYQELTGSIVANSSYIFAGAPATPNAQKQRDKGIELFSPEYVDTHHTVTQNEGMDVVLDLHLNHLLTGSTTEEKVALFVEDSRAQFKERWQWAHNWQVTRQESQDATGFGTQALLSRTTNTSILVSAPLMHNEEGRVYEIAFPAKRL